MNAWKWPALMSAALLAACSPAATDEEAAPNAAGAQRGDDAARAPLQAPAANGRLVVAFGDSLFAGYGLERGQGFAPVLERQLAAAGVPATVFDAAVSGDTTQAARQRLAFMLGGLPRKPDLVIVGFGGNDMLRGLGPEQTRANLEAILSELRTRQIPAMLTGMVAAPNLGRDYATAFNPIYPELAQRFDVPLYPFILQGVIGTPGRMLADGRHPSAPGVEAMAAGVAPLVTRALEPAPR
ncbi:MAG TPA: arylesterase [Allosphingosinicella sp.]